jgi:large subunit ribosomal protein L25
MDDAPVIDAQPRETGSKAARKIRKNDHVPCILYGRDTDPVPFQVPVPKMQKLIFGRTSPVFQVQLNGQSWRCIMKDYDLHPITDRPQHADFQVLREGRKVTLTVPIRFQGIPEGQKEGGDTQIVVREMTISVLPKNIPAEIEIDISGLAIGDSIHVYDLDVDYDIKMAEAQTLVTVVAPHLEPVATDEAEELEAEELEEGELPEGEEAEGEAAEGEEPEEGAEDEA